MSCCHAYEYEGYRTRSSYVPGYAQGAYFPGDEPGTKCKISGEYCGDEDGDCPDCCALQDEVNYLCPNCLNRSNDEILMKKSAHGVIFCPECKYTYDDEEDIISEHEENLYDANKRIKELQEKVEVYEKTLLAIKGNVLDLKQILEI